MIHVSMTKKQLICFSFIILLSICRSESYLINEKGYKLNISNMFIMKVTREENLILLFDEVVIMNSLCESVSIRNIEENRNVTILCLLNSFCYNMLSLSENVFESGYEAALMVRDYSTFHYENMGYQVIQIKDSAPLFFGLVDLVELDDFLMNSKSISATLKLSEKNPYIEFSLSPVYYILIVILYIANIGLLIWISYKVALMVKYDIKFLSVSGSLIVVEIVNTILRMILLVDPGMVFGLFGNTFVVSLSVFIPYLTTISTVIFGYYWLELFNYKINKKRSFLSKYVSQFITTIIFMLSISIFMIILTTWGLSWLTGIIYLLTCSLVLIFYLVSTIKFHIKIVKNTLSNLTDLIVKSYIIMVFMLLMMISSSMFNLPQLYKLTVLSFVLWVLVSTITFPTLISFMFLSIISFKRSKNTSKTKNDKHVSVNHIQLTSS